MIVFATVHIVALAMQSSSIPRSPLNPQIFTAPTSAPDRKSVDQDFTLRENVLLSRIRSAARNGRCDEAKLLARSLSASQDLGHALGTCATR